MVTLEELFQTAELYGKVRIYSCNDKLAPHCYHCSISFNTVRHVELEAKSAFGLELKEALKQAIEKAVLVVETVSGSASKQDIEKTKQLLLKS